jgi:hypothetical protein
MQLPAAPYDCTLLSQSQSTTQHSQPVQSLPHHHLQPAAHTLLTALPQLMPMAPALVASQPSLRTTLRFHDLHMRHRQLLQAPTMHTPPAHMHTCTHHAHTHHTHTPHTHHAHTMLTMPACLPCLCPRYDVMDWISLKGQVQMSGEPGPAGAQYMIDADMRVSGLAGWHAACWAALCSSVQRQRQRQQQQQQYVGHITGSS